MSIKVITVTTSVEETQPLIQSLEKNGWDWTAIHTTWQGFGTKLIETYRYLKATPEIESFIFCDAFDVLVLGGEDEFKEKLSDKFPGIGIVCSAEKGCWPNSSLSKLYPPTNSNFKYLNSGCYYAKSKVFIDMIERCMPDYESDDQLYMTERLLFDGEDIVLDTHQILFNSHSFIDENEYGYINGRIQIMGNQSVFLHKNGRTVDEKLNQMLNER